MDILAKIKQHTCFESVEVFVEIRNMLIDLSRLPPPTQRFQPVPPSLADINEALNVLVFDFLEKNTTGKCRCDDVIILRY